MGWRQFVIELESLEPDRVEALFARHGALSVTLSDAGDEPVLEPGPGKTPLWRRTSITGLFDADADLDALEDDLKRSLGLERLPGSRVEPLADRVWEREWLLDFRPLCFGRRLWVSPHGAPVPDDAAIVIRLDPGLAFGTGTHPTTALMLEWLDTLALCDLRVLDVGCGSGILAIGALLAGAGAATAIDRDPQALTATRQNACANGVAERLATAASLDEARGDFDVVVANILAQPLIDMAADLTARVADGGRLALSGLLDDQVDAVSAAYAGAIRFRPPVVKDGWTRLTGSRR